jgi:hypothetical protein
LHDHSHSTEHVIDRLNKTAPWIYIGLVAIMVIASTILFVRQIHQDKRIKGDTIAIQQQRHDACVMQNVHHDATLVKLNQLIAELPEKQRVQARASEGFTIALINSLSPKQDCDKVAPAP